MKALFNGNKKAIGQNGSSSHEIGDSNHRLSEPTFRHPNFLNRSESVDSTGSSGQCYFNGGNCYSNQHVGKTASLDYRTNNGHLNGSGQSNKFKKVKCVFLGDAKVGKTSLIVSYTTNGYPQNYVPTAFDNFSVLVKVDHQPVQLQLCDTAGQPGFDNLRPLCYPNTDVFVLCFSVVDPDSFYSLHSKWLPEVRRFLGEESSAQSQNGIRTCGEEVKSRSVPLLLVGTQSDRRTNVSTILDLSQCGETAIRPEEAEEYASEIGALRYVECSALTQHNSKDVFDACILAALGIPFDSDAGGSAKGGGGGKNSGKAFSSKIEKVRNLYSQEFKANGAISNVEVRKSFKKLKDKMKRSNSVDSAKYTSVQVRRQLSSGRINHVGLTSTQSKDNIHGKLTTTTLKQEKAKLNSSYSIPSNRENADVSRNLKSIPNQVIQQQNSSMSGSLPNSPSHSKLVTFSLMKSAFSPPKSPKTSNKHKIANDTRDEQSNNSSAKFLGKSGRKISSKSFDNFSCGNSTPKLFRPCNSSSGKQKVRKTSIKNNVNMLDHNQNVSPNEIMLQEIDKLKKGWRKLLCMA